MSKINLQDERNISMLMDFYELTMSNAYFLEGIGDKIVYFDMFFRKVPDNGGYAIVAGLQQLIEIVQGFNFEKEDIDYLKGLNIFSKKFLSYLEEFKFTGTIYAVREGTPIFPNEPIVTVKAKVIEAQLLETILLITINHQSLIATKANRICRAAKGRGVLEFGARRAQGYDGALYGARAAYIGGCVGTATALAGEKFNIPVVGTMAHSWIQLFDDEYRAFEVYAKNYPDSCTLLVDTYDVIHSGIPNAIKVAKNILIPKGKRLKGVRLDSGDMAYLSKKVREMLDESGLNDCKIIASNSLDELTIASLLNQEADIDLFGVGERLITSKSQPVFGGVYKLVAVENEKGEPCPRIKLSENVEKVTNPGYKKLYRFFDNNTKKAIADLIAMSDEDILNKTEYEIFDSVYPWKKKELRNFYIKELQETIFEEGKLVYRSPSLKEIQDYCKEEIDVLWEELKRFENPHNYYVDLSKKLWDLKNKLIFEKKDL